MVGSSRVSGSLGLVVWIALATSVSCGVPNDATGDDEDGLGGESGEAGSQGSGGSTVGGGSGAGSGTAGNATGGDTTGGRAGEGGSGIGGSAQGGDAGDAGGEAGTDTGGAGGNVGTGGAAAGAAGRPGGAGNGGASGAGGRPGGAGGGGAGGVGAAGGGGGKGAVGVPCGTDNCSPPNERCNVTSAGVASCFAAAACPGGCVVLECDGPEDCTAGDVCAYSLGENQYLRCFPVTLGAPLACSTAADCPGNAPCMNMSGNFTQLGWQPRYCTSGV